MAGSGPGVARAFQVVLAALFGVAFLSLGVQVTDLIGHWGLLPLDLHLEQLEALWEPEFWEEHYRRVPELDAATLAMR